MINHTAHRFPVGVQTFERLREDGFIYIDKTDIIWRLTKVSPFVFLSRPRRFGKSLLTTTLDSYFKGQRELFEGLKIMDLEKEWLQYPVIHVDLSLAKNQSTANELQETILYQLEPFSNQFGKKKTETSPGKLLTGLIRRAYEQTGRQVVVLIDEYDAPLFDVLGKEQQTEYRRVLQEFYQPLKACEAMIRFCFITGITKFSQLSIFSTLNNLTNISMHPDFECICGFTEEELTTQMGPDIEMLAQKRGKTYEQTLDDLKQMYDGYHFSKGMTDIYNPFSMMKAMQLAEIGKYWFESATPSALISMLRHMPSLNIAEMENRRCPDTAFDLPFDSYQSPLPVLYQSGYITIKDYQDSRQIYTLGFPNYEVRTGFADALYQIVSGTQPDDLGRSVFLDAYYDFRDTDDLPAFIEAIRTFFAGVPYHWEHDNRNEHYYHALLYTLLTAFGADIRVEDPTAKGRCDITLKMPRGIYVMELKYDHPVEEALEQIETKGYAEKYRLDGRPVTKVGISFSSKERNITDWKSL